jgi:hypothetical protein
MVANADAGAETPGVKLNEEDRARMASLYEEVSGLVENMVAIVARALGKDTHTPSEVSFARRMHLEELSQETLPSLVTKKGTQLVRFTSGETACYDFDLGLATECNGNGPPPIA